GAKQGQGLRWQRPGADQGAGPWVGRAVGSAGLGRGASAAGQWPIGPRAAKGCAARCRAAKGLAKGALTSSREIVRPEAEAKKKSTSETVICRRPRPRKNLMPR